jgi:hypothetical protein
MTLPNEEILVLGTYGSTLSANKAVDAPFPPSSDWEPGAPVIWDNDAVRQYQCATMVNLNQPGSGASSAHMRYVAAYDTNSLSSGMLGIDRSADAIYSEFVLIDPNDPEPPEIVSVSGANVGGNLCVVVLTGDGGLWFTYENPVTTWHTESWLDLRTIPGGSRRFVAVDTAKVIGGPNSGLAVVALDSDGILTHMLIPPPVVIFDPPQLPVPWSDFEVVVRDFTWSPAVGCARLEYTRTDAQGNVTAAVDGLYVVVSSAGSIQVAFYDNEKDQTGPTGQPGHWGSALFPPPPLSWPVASVAADGVGRIFALAGTDWASNPWTADLVVPLDGNEAAAQWSDQGPDDSGGGPFGAQTLRSVGVRL